MTDCIVVGGGVIGMLTARYLHEEGVDVLVLDRGQLGGEASWAGGGILSPLYPWRYSDAVNRLARESQDLYPRFTESLRDETGIDPEWTQNGLLMLDTDQQAPALAWSKQAEVDVACLDDDALHIREPGLASDFRQGLWFSTVAQIRNPRLIKALRASFDRRDIRYRERTSVQGLIIEKNCVHGVRTGSENLMAQTVVITGGAWSTRLMPAAYMRVQIEPVRGQMILFKATRNTLKHILLYQDQYLIPRRDGRILSGSTLEYAGFDKGVTRDAREILRQAALEMVPALADFPIEHHWSGLRPGSPGGIPYIGEHPDIKGLFLNCGHFRYGVVLGLGSARLVTDLIAGFPARISPQPYAVGATR